MSQIEDSFVSDCQNILAGYRSSISQNALYKLESDLKNKAWSTMFEVDVPEEQKPELYSRLSRIVDTLVMLEVCESVCSGSKNFKAYVDNHSQNYELRWYAEFLSERFILRLQQKSNIWVDLCEVKTLFESINDVKAYLERLEMNTGVPVPLSTE